MSIPIQTARLNRSEDLIDTPTPSSRLQVFVVPEGISVGGGLWFNSLSLLPFYVCAHSIGELPRHLTQPKGEEACC